MLLINFCNIIKNLIIILQLIPKHKPKNLIYKNLKQKKK